MIKVTILLCEQLSLFELGCATELFALPRPEFSDWYTTQTVTLGSNNFAGLGNTQFQCPRVTTLPDTDLLVIPSFPVTQSTVSQELASEVLRHYHNGGRIISFCSGAFLLAALGLLNQRTAITHWRYAEQFKARFPHVSYRDDNLYWYDGKIGCSAGSAAAIDLGIAVIREDFGYEYANTVARRMVLPAHRDGGQSQFVQRPLGQKSSALSQVMDWAVKNAGPGLTIDQIASKANMTRRTFDRQFIRQFKITPHQWLCERKLEIARQLLETTSLPIEQIAGRAGFDNAVTLRHNFKKFLSISPSRYRQTFQQCQDTG
ncbi:transcriptional regulator [Alteromonas lipolytica]|uniref:Transcriptional regulator n=2 Tax=Alteromonas lipolytica TaxID=1856405 RepID=A0A1E8FIR2_9ALTE|nr:transcriptional regulator [Alteromonas lipolytica]